MRPDTAASASPTPKKKPDSKAALDLASWSFNVTTSVGLIMVNKALMATYGFTFGACMCCVLAYLGILILTVIIY